MRLLSYLNEFGTPVTDDMWDTIKKDCSYYIENFLHKHNTLFYKGAYNVTKDTLMHANTKKRTSLILNTKYFDFINNGLTSNGFLSRASSLILTPSITAAQDFGIITVIFPIGKFKYTYCKARDFNMPNDPFSSAYFAGLYCIKNKNNIEICTKYISNYYSFDAKYYTSKKQLQLDKLPDDAVIYISTGTFEDELPISKLKHAEKILTTTLSNTKFNNIKNYEFGIDCKEFYYYSPTNNTKFEILAKDILGD